MTDWREVPAEEAIASLEFEGYSGPYYDVFMTELHAALRAGKYKLIVNLDDGVTFLGTPEECDEYKTCHS